VRSVIVLIVFIVFISSDIFGQEQVRGNNIIGLNMTEMVSQLVPFGSRTTVYGPYQFMWRTGKNGKMLNLQFGFQPDSEERFGYGNVALGFSRMKNLGEKFYWTSTQSIMITSGDLNIRKRSEFFFDEGGLGVDVAWGLGYRLGQRVSIFTEARLVAILITDFGDRTLDFVPPIGVFIVADLSK